MKPQRLHQANNFDALRLAAALAVLFSHQYPVTGTTPPEWMNVAMVGGVAVMAFFVISGYLVTLSWFSQPRLWVFCAKRALRIWPALAAVVLLAIFVLGPSLTTLALRDYFHHPMTWDYLHNMLLQIRWSLPGVFENNALPHTVNGSLWTIPMEVSCYAVLAAAGTLGLLRWRWVWACCCLGYLLWFLTQMTMDLRGVMTHWWEFPAYFVFGSLIATVSDWFLRYRLACCAAACVAGGLLWACGFSYSALLLFLPAVLVGVGTLSWPVLRQAGGWGDVSYGVYLYAFPVQQTVRYLWPEWGFACSLALVTTLTLLAGWLSWLLVEAPTLRLKRFLR
ncbi:acyltransferase family protein [Comamonas sediminis]|uniref:acyltransferase family protein n=1 Tax=Comamonas sediminis TaxID=1783360 RepID=UPI003D2658C4